MHSSSGSTFFHCFSAEADPNLLLDPNRQFTDPWGSPDHGPCDKCEGEGEAAYECCSCLEGGTDPECPSCGGRVRFLGVCPTCHGSGEIDRTRRRGIAVFPTREGLYRYLAGREDADVEGRAIVELEGSPSDDRDLDADAGALLVHPQRIVSVEPLQGDLVHAIRARLRVEEKR